jgi:solute carrier family 25 phosphate transporter 23/24/25/41
VQFIDSLSFRRNVVRTRLQAQGTPSHPQRYTGIKDAAMKCYQMEGWRGFYKGEQLACSSPEPAAKLTCSFRDRAGLTPTLVKVVPAVAISC